MYAAFSVAVVIGSNRYLGPVEDPDVSHILRPSGGD
jgi:hypothetical protein